MVNLPSIAHIPTEQLLEELGNRCFAFVYSAVCDNQGDSCRYSFYTEGNMATCTGLVTMLDEYMQSERDRAGPA